MAFLARYTGLALAGAAVLLIGTFSVSAQTPPPAPPRVNDVLFTAVDFAFHGPDTVPAGLTRITLVNMGTVPHHMQLVKLPPGLTIQDIIDALRPGAPEAPPPPGIVDAGGPGTVFPTGASNAVVNLEPGTYALLCFVPDPQGVPHAALGMIKGLTVTPTPSAPAPPPAADLSVGLVEYAFQLSGPVTAGLHTIQITNSGHESHEMQVVQLAPGKTVQDFLAGLEATPSPAGLPGTFVGGLQAVAAGSQGLVTSYFQPGSYVLICFVADEETGQPHYLQGMVQEITVQ